MKEFSILVAIARNMAIGKDNRLIWHIPEDLKRFKALTTGHTVVMGRKTYESLPFRPLPKRRNLVITRDKSLQLPGCVMAHSIEDAIGKMDNDRENFIIGGAEIFRDFMPLAHKLYITWVHKDFEADTFYPEINPDEWTETEREDIEAMDTLGFNYSYVTYIRK